jgi:ech hydrogenase subunit C
MYDVERFGIINTGNPKHADVFLVTGAINEQNKGVVKQIYEQMPEPKVVVAIGICATSGGIFKECYNILGGTDTVIPVDVYVPGCAARPEAIIDGVVKGLGVLAAKKEAMIGKPKAVLQVTELENIKKVEIEIEIKEEV